MEFIDLKKQQKKFRSSLNLRLKKVLDDSRYILGEEVTQLEKELSSFCESKHVIACSNGTDALMLALMTLDIGPGDGVITIPFTYIATLESIAAVGATPVLVDVYDSTFNINVDEIEHAIKSSDKKIKAIMPVDLFGLPARYRVIKDIAKYNLKIIADAPNLLVHQKKKKSEHSGITTTSFFPAKPLGCYGDGGAVFTDSSEYNTIIKSLAIHGKGVDKYDNVRIGMNSRLDTIQAAVLLEKLKIFPKEIESRNKIATLYRDKLNHLPLKFQVIPKGYRSVYAQFSILFNNEETRDRVQLALKNNNIPSVIYYVIPGHLQTGYKYLNYNVGDFPVSEDLSKRILSLPMHPYLIETDIEKITKIIEKETK